MGVIVPVRCRMRGGTMTGPIRPGDMIHLIWHLSSPPPQRGKPPIDLE